MQLKDHYKTLGVSSASSSADIRKAYRKLALIYHPDKNSDSLSIAHFAEIQEAYSILSDQRKKRNYDEERWLSGMGRGMKEMVAITSEYLASEATRLNKYIATIDTYRMSHQSLADYILLLLSDAHLAILNHHADAASNATIIETILHAINHLDSPHYEKVSQRLLLLAGADGRLTKMIQLKLADHQRLRKWNKIIPYLIAGLTILLCLTMYLYGLKGR